MKFLHVWLIGVVLVTCASARSKDSFVFENDVRTPKAGSMLIEIAKELLQRSSSSSQVLNLNLSNLLLILVLKAVVYGAGFLGPGQGQNARTRELPDTSGTGVTEGEVALALGYFMGENCLYRAACEEPQTARDYLDAADLIMQTVKLLPNTSTVEDKYDKTITEFRKAIEYGYLKKCPPEYNCKKESIDTILTSD